MWSNEQLAYMAAIIDGEGSIGIEHLKPTKGRKKDYYVCRLTVINTSFVLMRWLKETFGGTFNTYKVIIGKKTFYRWHIFGKGLDEVLTAIQPFLLIKRIQASVVLEYRTTVGKTGWNVSDEVLEHRRKLWIQCKEWNQMGAI
jgi:hypothetical protein